MLSAKHPTICSSIPSEMRPCEMICTTSTTYFLICGHTEIQKLPLLRHQNSIDLGYKYSTHNQVEMHPRFPPGSVTKNANSLTNFDTSTLALAVVCVGCALWCAAAALRSTAARAAKQAATVAPSGRERKTHRPLHINNTRNRRKAVHNHNVVNGPSKVIQVFLLKSRSIFKLLTIILEQETPVVSHVLETSHVAKDQLC